MQTLKTLVVAGDLVARQPLTVSPPGASWGGDKSKIQRLPRFGFGSGEMHYIPASTLRHVIRYGVARVVQAALREQGKSLSFEAILALDKGFIGQKKSKKKQSASAQEQSENKQLTAGQNQDKDKKLKLQQILEREIEVRERNPLLSLLGTWGLASELRVLNVIPQRNETGHTLAIASGIVRKPLEDGLVDMLDESGRQAYLNKMDEWTEESTKKNNGDDDSGEVGLRHINERPWEEISPGTVCNWGYAIQRVDPLKSGAVLAALRAFAADPVIGAHRAVGRGEIALSLSAQTVTHDVLREPTVEEVGTVRLERGKFEVTGLLSEHLSHFDEQARAGFPGIDFGLLPEVAGSSNED